MCAAYNNGGGNSRAVAVTNPNITKLDTSEAGIFITQEVIGTITDKGMITLHIRRHKVTRASVILLEKENVELKKKINDKMSTTTSSCHHSNSNQLPYHGAPAAITGYTTAGRDDDDDDDDDRNFVSGGGDDDDDLVCRRGRPMGSPQTTILPQQPTNCYNL